MGNTNIYKPKKIGRLKGRTIMNHWILGLLFLDKPIFLIFSSPQNEQEIHERIWAL
jgi:hypothetical protein